MKTLLAVSAVAAFTTFAQTPSPSVAPAWDVAQSAAALAEQSGRLKPLLDRLTPEMWVQNGAPEAYVAQWRDTRQQLTYLTGAAQTLVKQPERLTAALDTYFRLQAVETGVNSLAEGARKYVNPAAGDALVSVLGENTVNQDRLRDYISDLAAQKDAELTVVDKEAQRCRGQLNLQPAPKPQPKKPAR